MKHIRNYHLRTERWRDVEEFEGLYQASTTGKVINRKTGKILKPDVMWNGYCRVTLFKNGIRKRYLVHRLIAKTFKPNLKNKPEIDHINTHRNDNCVWNLKWVTKSENQKNPLTVIKKRNSRIGYKISEETRQKLSEAHKGKKLSPLSEEAKQKISEAHKKKIIQIKDEIYIKVWDSALDIENELGYWHTAIADVCRGRKRTAYGFVWKYA